mgnify:CR=1 FL=1
MKLCTKILATFFARRFGNYIKALTPIFITKGERRVYYIPLYIRKGHFLPRKTRYFKDLSYFKNVVRKMVRVLGEERKK